MPSLGRRAALAAPALLLARGTAAQEAWPGRPVTLIVPWAPGGSNDVAARLLTPALEARFGQPFVVENRPGGGGSLGMGMAARARPDGYTLLVSSASNHVFHPLIAQDLGYDVQQALQPICMLVDVPNVLAVSNAFGVRTVPELIEKVRRMRGGASFGSSGVGSSNHLAGELLKLRTGLDLTHVPYRGGGQAIADLISDTVPMVFLNLPTISGPAAAGQVRIIAVGSAERVRSRPEIPTIQEQGVPDFAVRSWTGLFAPRGTPPAVTQALAPALREILETPAIRQRLTDMGSEPIWMDAAETERFVRADVERWGPVVKAAKVTLD
ncbi:Bug family tripartite tricarboxylate transporter substrate binding protein [Paracraurococcus lichenis]|uniref:Tripartite tricarboxylate transporter substrate binding protein n=1 Tax=Paracraurococcus lichenis TaxID=3064888 RepID=A0ABT9DTE7_9PROT|nr:tripartite tricarboxylate transporter substrate binding protein [Paracraurococcus sp. LOR1-02]MDO9707159.1 tripartite tricarboxylate transporter substrate binding protein [Paracraurococcus sp. LOR1-02]